MSAATSFRSMDESTAEQWAVIGVETAKNQGRVADRVLGHARARSAEITDGFATDQLTHCLQTATRAERAGADDEVVVASLCHDIGKAVSVPEPPGDRRRDPQAVRAARGAHDDPGAPGLPGPRTTTTTSAATRTPASSTAPTSPTRSATLAEQFADDWDQTSFDPDYDTLPLEHFEPKVRAGLRVGDDRPGQERPASRYSDACS